MRRVLVISLVGHVLAIGLFVWTPKPRASLPALPGGVVSVEIVSAPPGARPAAPKAVSRRAPKKTVVLPDEASAKPMPKPKPAARKEKPRPKAPPPRQKTLAEAMAELEKKAGAADELAAAPRTTRAAPAGAATGAVGVAAGSGPRRVDAETAGWLRRARIHVRQSWVLPPGFRTQDLETHVSVRLDGGGRVVGEPRVTRRSGNPWYDDSVVRALEKASPLPAPPDAGEWPFVFRPEDIL